MDKLINLVLDNIPAVAIFPIALLLLASYTLYRENTRLREYNRELHAEISKIYQDSIDRINHRRNS